MINLFNKGRLLALLALSCVTTCSLSAWDDYNNFDTSASSYDTSPSSCDTCPSNRLYVGGFGGILYSNSTKLIQMGTAFFSEDVGGPLAVLAQGHTKEKSAGYGGVQIGYEWSNGYTFGCTGWSIAPALELEGYWYSHKKKGHLTNPTTRLPEHDFLDSFHLDSGVYLANAVFSLKNACFGAYTPYVGGGVGATRISLTKANSLQTDPPEAGINHFNSKRSDSSWAFAAQVKAGVRYNFCKSFHIFAEYRYLYVDTSNYIFGSTVYTTHAPTSPWNVRIKDIQYNAFAVGFQFDLY